MRNNVVLEAIAVIGGVMLFSFAVTEVTESRLIDAALAENREELVLRLDKAERAYAPWRKFAKVNMGAAIASNGKYEELLAARTALETYDKWFSK